MNTSMASTTFAFLSSFSMTDESLARRSPSPAMSDGSSDSLTEVMSLSIVRSSLFTSSGRVMLLAALASFHPSLLAHFETVCRLTAMRSAISVSSMPERNKVRPSAFLFSNSALFIFAKMLALIKYLKTRCKIGQNGGDCKRSVQPFHRSVQAFHTYLLGWFETPKFAVLF